MLGLFAVTASPIAAARIDTHAALSGVFMQIFNHGITAAALFYYVGCSSSDAACAALMISAD